MAIWTESTSANMTLMELHGHHLPMNESELLRIATTERVSVSIPVICFMCVLIVVGSLGNGLVFWTYFRRIHLCSTNLFIFSLSILDFVSCSFGLSAEVFDLFNPYTNDFDILCSTHKFVSFAGDLASGYIIVCISFDRFMRIARPHQGLSIRTSRISVSAICGTSLTICSMCLFVYGVRPIKTRTSPPVEGIGCGTNPEAKKTMVPLIFSTIILVCFLVGFILLLTVYIRLGVKVHRWYQARCAKHDNKAIKPSRRTKSTFSEESSSKLESNPSTCNNKEAQTFEFPTSGADESNTNNNANGISFRSGYVRQLSKSLDKNNFFKLDTVAPEDNRTFMVSTEHTRTLPLPKSPSFRTDQVSRPLRKESSSANSFSVMKRRMKLSKTTIMFITAAVAYFVCHVPYTCYKVVTLMQPKFTREISPAAEAILKFAEYSYSISYVANPVIYSFMNPNFRKECRILMNGIKNVITCKRRTLNHRYDF